MLAQHPDVQQQIYSEVSSTLGPGTIATADDVPRLPLIRGLVKETLRYRPHRLLDFHHAVLFCFLSPLVCSNLQCRKQVSIDFEKDYSPLFSMFTWTYSVCLPCASPSLIRLSQNWTLWKVSCIVWLNSGLCVSLLGSRLFPVLPGNGRITQDDLVVGEYFIPKGVRHSCKRACAENQVWLW